MTLRADELLTEVEPLPYGARCRDLAKLRHRVGSDELRDLLHDLGGRGHYERSLSLFIAAAAKDETSLDHIGAMMRDPASDLASGAIGWAARLGVPYEPFAELLRDAPSALRATAYEAIRRWRRADLADRLIDAVAERWGEGEAASLLCACGEDAARDRLDDLAHAVSNWKSFGHAHPGLMLDYAERDLAGTPEALRVSWWFWHGNGVAAAVPHAPGRVIGLLERYWGASDLGPGLGRRLGELIQSDPARVLALLLVEKHRRSLPGLLWRRSVCGRVVGLDETGGAAAAVARAVRDDPRTLARLLKLTPPSRRDALFTAAMTGIDLSAAEIDPEIMEVLPHATRAREARRMLGLGRVAENPHRVRELTAYLPYDEAVPVLLEMARRPDGDDRAIGYRLLVECAGRTRDPDVLTSLLDTTLGRLRNEQDPVRLQAVTALAAMPTSMLRASHVPAFTQITTDALNARDCSFGTRFALTRLAVKLCHQGAAEADRVLLVLAFDILRALAGQQGTLQLGRLDQGLPAGREREIGHALSAYLDGAGRREDHRLALALARALGDRAELVPEIQDGLERALDARDDTVIREAIGLWLRPSRTRAERVGRIVAKDASTVTIPPVFAAIGRDRTDLLRLVLSDTAPPGRFQHPRVRYVPLAVPSWTRRWTARQRADYIALLHRVAGDADAPAAERGQAVSTLGRILGADIGDLRRYYEAGRDDENGAFLARLALTSVVWLPSPQDVLPELLDLAASDDAHIAMYAATRAARFVPPSALTAALAPVLTTGKITARKEALRILLHNRVPDAMDVVGAAWDDPGQHRDVRVAIASAVRDRLGDPRAHRILAEAANGPCDLARQIVATHPYMIEVRHRPIYAGLVLAVARSADREARLAALAALSSWASYAPEIPPLLAGHLTSLDDTLTWRRALTSLITCALTGTSTEHLVSAAESLATAPDRPDADAQRDLPARQRLTELVTLLRTWHRNDRTHLEALVPDLAGRLPEPLASELVAATLRWDADPAEVETALDSLASRPIGGVLATDRVARALAYGRESHDLDQHPGTYRYSAPDPDPETVLPHAARLAARNDPTPALFACALTAYHGDRAGWPDTWRTILRRLRTHPHPDVAYSANSVHTANE